MASLVKEIAEKVFSKAPLGYNRDDVDEFLNYVIDEVDRIERRNLELAAKLNEAENRRAYAPVQEAVPVPMPLPVQNVPKPAEQPASQPMQSIPRPVTAQETASVSDFKPAVFTPAVFTPAPIPVPAAVEVKPARTEEKTSESSASATALLDRAQKLYDETIADAKKTAEKIIAEAREQAAEEADKLLRDKKELEDEIEMLRAGARDYRRRFNQLVEDQKYLFKSEKALFGEE